MKEYILNIRQLTQHYLAFKMAVHLDPKVRGFEMHKARGQWQILAAMYCVFRRQQMLRRAIMDSQQFRGN